MISWIKNLFFQKEEVVTPPEPTPSPLVQKVADWILSIKREDMATQSNDGKGYEINLVDSIDDENIIKKIILWEVNEDDSDTQRSIVIERIEKKDIFKELTTLYFIIELSKGEETLTFNELFEDNINHDNKRTLRRMFYHMKALHDYSAQKAFLNKAQSEKEKKYKEFTENF